MLFITYAAKFMHLFRGVATTLMIKNVSTTAGADFIQMIWSKPKIAPDSYRVNIACWLMHTKTIYVRVTVEASPLDKMLTIDKLIPGSRCVITLHAIYNPASIDDGIARTISTVNSNVCNM